MAVAGWVRDFFSEVWEFSRTLQWYLGRKLYFWGVNFEEVKGIVVDLLKARRGIYQRPFIHLALVVLTVTLVFSAPLLADRYPTAASSGQDEQPPTVTIRLPGEPDLVDLATVESQKPRRDLIEHIIVSGDTVSSIAKHYGVDTLSVNYLNKFSAGEILHPGDRVKIPPVSGVIVTVQRGDNIYLLAKKYSLPSAQAIVDWPYNSFIDDEKFTLAVGQTLVIPNGVPPEEVPVAPVPQRTPGPALFAHGTGLFAWPTTGTLSQYFAFYHNGIDIASNGAPAIIAADSGRVTSVQYLNYGYGYHVIVDHGNGYKTLYGHMNRIDVGVGENVSRGQRLGVMGSTGRSTGPHLHFVVFQNGVAVNPLGFLK